MLDALRQPRYAALSALMLLVATICVLLGVWQVDRLSTKHDTNITLRHNAHAAPVPASTLLHQAGRGPEPQHLAYVIQWFLFAALALAAPVVMARADARHDDRDIDDDAPPPSLEEQRAARLADRYGRARH